MNDFWFGYSLCVIQYAFAQDLIGKDQYLKVMDAAWIHTSPWVWPPVAIGLIVMNVLYKRLKK